MEEVDNSDLLTVVSSNLSLGRVLDLDTSVHCKHEHLASFGQEDLSFSRIGRERLIVHGHTLDTIVVLASNNEQGRSVQLFWFAWNGEFQGNLQALWAAVASWEHDYSANSFDVRIDPLVFHWSTSKQQERAGHVPLNTPKFFARSN